MDKQKELDLIEEVKALFSDDQGLRQVADVYAKTGDDFKFKLQSATWAALGEVPEAMA